MAIIDLNDQKYVTRGPISRSVIQQFAAPVRSSGQTGRGDVQVPQQLIIGDLSLGEGVRDFNVAKHQDALGRMRFRDATVQTHFGRGIRLPALTVDESFADNDGGVRSFFFVLNGTLYFYNLQRNDAGSGNFDWDIEVYSWSGSAWSTVDNLEIIVTSGAVEFRGGQPGVFGGSAWIPIYRATSGRTEYIEFDGSTITRHDAASASILDDGDFVLAFAAHRGTFVALILDGDGTTIRLAKTTTPQTPASWTSHMTWTKGTGFVPAYIVEGQDSDGVLQLYVMLGDTIFQIDWDGGTAFHFLHISASFAQDDGAPGNRAPLATDAPMVWHQGAIVSVTDDGRIFSSTPSGIHTQIGLNLDDGPADADYMTEVRCLQSVGDLLLLGTHGRAYIHNGFGWSVIMGDADQGRDVRRIFWDGTGLHTDNEYNNDAGSLQLLFTQLNDLDRVVVSGATAYAASGFFETARFDMGFPEQEGLVYRVHLRANDITSTETLVVKYKIDGAASWTTLGTMNTAVTHVHFDFGSGLGTKFVYIEFQVNFARGGTITLTPEFIELVLDSEKIMDPLERYECTIDAEETIEKYGGKGSKRSIKTVHDELFALMDPHATTSMVVLKYGDKSKNVRMVGMGSSDFSDFEKPERQDFSELPSFIGLTMEERITSITEV